MRPSLAPSLWKVLAAGSFALLVSTPGTAWPNLGIDLTLDADQRSLPPLFPQAGLTPTTANELRAMSRTLDVQTARRLIEVAREGAFTLPEMKLELARALAAHESKRQPEDDLRSQLVRALALLFEADPNPSSVGSGDDMGPLRHLVRGTAAMALARSAHPEAVRKLVAVALHGTQEDPVGSRLARKALESVPRASLGQETLEPLFDAKSVALALAAEEALAAQLAPPTPRSLVTRNKNASKNTSGDREALSWEQAMQALTMCRVLPEQYSHIAAWHDAYHADPTWTLRSLALLKARLPTPVIKKGATWAAKSVESAGENERSAAAFYLSVSRPDSADALLARNDPIISAAVLFQASGGEVARTVARRLAEGSFKPDSLKPTARKLVLLSPDVWRDISTLRLRKRKERENDPSLIAPLASRLRTGSSGLGPDVATVRAWLRHDRGEVRIHAALGLALAKQDAASGLLFSAYRKEADPLVRRALLSALSERKLLAHSEVERVVSLDPDAGCRAIFEARRDASLPGMLFGFSSRSVVRVLDRLGRIHHLTPAPDGFFGAVGALL